MDKIIGFIGCGNMGQAMIGGLVKSDTIAPKNIIASTSKGKVIENRFDVGLQDQY